MTLPSTGPLSINDIRVELGASATNQSLRAFSNTAGFTTPDAISDFYGYSHLTSFSYSGTLPYEDAATACSEGGGGSTAYHNGSGTYPVNGDDVYSDSSGTSPLSDGFYKRNDGKSMEIENGAVKGNPANCGR